MVGRQAFPFGTTYFSGANYYWSFRECSTKTWLWYWVIFDRFYFRCVEDLSSYYWPKIAELDWIGVRVKPLNIYIYIHTCMHACMHRYVVAHVVTTLKGSLQLVLHVSCLEILTLLVWANILCELLFRMILFQLRVVISSISSLYWVSLAIKDCYTVYEIWYILELCDAKTLSGCHRHHQG